MLEKLAHLSEEKAARDREKLERMMQYGQSAACRWRLLHDYFGEEIEGEQCGTCDNCLHPPGEQLRTGGVTHNATPNRSGNGMPDASRRASGGITGVAARSATGDRETSEVCLSVGDTVEHHRYRTGRVQSLEGDKVVIEFGRGETRKFKEELIRDHKRSCAFNRRRSGRL